MAVIKLNICSETSKELKAAAEYFGEEINEEFYGKMIDDFLANRRENIAKPASKSDKRLERKMLKATATAYKRDEKQKRKERKGKPAEIIILPAASEETAR